jgi:hypothetical protein
MNARTLVWLALFVGCVSHHDAVSLPVALPATPPPEPPQYATRVDQAGDGAWARSLRHEKGFAEYDLPDKEMLLLDWRVGPHVQLSRLNIPDDDFAVNFGSYVELAVDRVSIAFGPIPGRIVAPELTYCARLGWHKPDGPVVFPAYVVSQLTLDIPQSADDFMIVRDGATLHVLHRHADDDSSTDGPWSIRANLHVAGRPVLYERVEQASAPCDCGAPLGEGTRLLAPG